MSNELMAIVQGYIGYLNDYDGKKTFKPTEIVYTSYSDKYLEKKLQEYRDESKKNKSEWEAPKKFKLVKASKYAELLASYNFRKWTDSLFEDIDYKFKDIGNEYLNALKFGIGSVCRSKGISKEELMSFGANDITYTTSANESISARCRTSTWSFNVKGMFGTFPFEGTSYDVSGL